MFSITGGSGFVGSTLSARLAELQTAFRILDRRESPVFPERRVACDICNINDLRATLTGDTVIHLAAEHRDDVTPISRYYDVNVQGTENVALVAREKGINRIIFTSSVAVYGFAHTGTGEDGAINPFNEYGRTKYAAEEVLRRWQAENPGERSLTIIRPTVIFGPGNRGNVYNLLSFISSGKFIMIGPGRNRKSMAFVRNVAAFLHHATDFGPGVHIYNYVDKPDLTMNELVEVVRKTLFGKSGTGLRLPFWFGMCVGHAADLVARWLGRTLPVSAIRVRKFCAETSFTSSAHGVPGFDAKVPLAEALAITMQEDFIAPDPQAPVFYTE